MPLGNENEERYSLDDTANLRTALYDNNDRLIPADEITSVTFTVQKPDEDKTRVTAAGNIETDGAATLLFTDTDIAGEYITVATFVLDNGIIKSKRWTFEVYDPFSDLSPSGEETIADQVWMRLEDCFDSTEGGPWLRDYTLSYFNKRKVAALIPDALFDINFAVPITNATIIDFTLVQNDGSADPDQSLLVQGTLLATIRHLMRSYTEQPVPQGAQVVYEDRTQYLDRWHQIYEIELERYQKWLALWKRQFLGLGHTKILVSAKAGRLLPAPLRSRNIGRGYY